MSITYINAPTKWISDAIQLSTLRQRQGMVVLSIGLVLQFFGIRRKLLKIARGVMLQKIIFTKLH